MNSTTPETDVIRRRFPDPELPMGFDLLRRLGAVTVEPVRRDRRLLVYPIAVVMAIGIGVLGHVLGPSDQPAASPPATQTSPAQTVDTARDASAEQTTRALPSDGDSAVPSPRTR